MYVRQPVVIEGVGVHVSVCLAVPWHCVDGGRRRHRLLLVLPGSKEFAHHGVIQEPYTSSRTQQEAVLLQRDCAMRVSVEILQP